MVDVSYYGKSAPMDRFPLVTIVTECSEKNITITVGQPGNMSKIVMTRTQAAILAADLKRAITRFDNTEDGYSEE